MHWFRQIAVFANGHCAPVTDIPERHIPCKWLINSRLRWQKTCNYSQRDGYFKTRY
jgi:hypothetical protein